MGFVFVTGLGSRRVEEPLHLDSLAFIKLGKPPIPGIPVFGPTESVQEAWNAEATAAFYPSSDSYPLGWRYGDTRLFVRANEFSVWEIQGPFVELFALPAPPGLMPPQSWRPGGIGHRSPCAWD